MKDYKMIEMLDSIPKIHSYSIYSHSLEKMFKKNCLKDLLYDLKYPKTFDQGEFIDSNKQNRSRRNQGKFYNDKFTDLDTFTVPFIPKNQLEKNTDASKANNQSPKLANRRKMLTLISDVPEPGKYNPNYQAISKNIPSILIKAPNTDLSRLRKREELLSERIERMKIKKQIGENTTENNKDNNALVTKTEKRLGRNHALNFNQYISRKEEKIPDFHLPKLTYLEPFDYLTNINKAPDFKKMKKRAENDLLNQNSLDIPSICYYQPKYGVIEKASPQISFSKEQPKATKQYLLKKLWKSYDVEPGYQLVNLPMITEPPTYKTQASNN